MHLLDARRKRRRPDFRAHPAAPARTPAVMGRWAPASEIEAETGKDRIMQTRVATAAQAPAEATATLAYWVFVALLLGAISAVLGSRLGTRRIVGAQQVVARPKRRTR